MSDEAEVLSGGDAISYPTADTSAMSVEEAARSLTDARHKTFAKINEPPAESAEEATAETELLDESNAAPQEEATGETQEDAPAEEPPRDLPRSWTKDRSEHWAKLDPATQDFLLEQDRKASAEVRRVQNEAAEKLKGLTAKEQEVEKVRVQSESKIKFAMEVLEREQLRDFADIKTMADVERMAMEDPFRKIQWDTHQQKMQVVAWEAQQAEQRKAQAEQTEWATHVQKENALAAELIPELADKVKGPALTARAAERLTELGFKDDELRELATGKSRISLYDHRLQQLIFSDLKLSDIQKAKVTAVPKTLPPVQRPGVRQPAGASVTAQIQTLEKQLSSASGDRAARISAEIWALEKRSRSA